MLQADGLLHTLFVYGTLKRFFTNHMRYLGVAEARGGAEFLGRAVTVQKFPLVVRPADMPPVGRCGPVMMHKAGDGHQITGEIFKVDSKTLEAMDILEGVKSGAYFKDDISVVLDSVGSAMKESTELQCIAYFYPAKDELMELECVPTYSAAQHALYQPGPVNEEIFELCDASRDSAPSTHTLYTKCPCTMATHSLRLLPGDDIVQSLRAFVKSIRANAVCVLTCVGSTSRTTLRPAGVKVPKVYEQKYEILSMTGTLSPTGHHLHMSISDADCNVYGGHMMDGCIVRTTAEIVIGILSGIEFSRPLDARTGYDELSIGVAESGVAESGSDQPDPKRALRSLRSDQPAPKRARQAYGSSP